MNKDYTKYTAEKLLEDDFFIDSNTSPTLDTINFWKRQVVDGLDEQEYRLAIFFLRSIKVKKEQMTKTLSFVLFYKAEFRKQIYRGITDNKLWIISSNS